MAALADDRSRRLAPDEVRAARRGSAYLAVVVVVGLAAWLLGAFAAFNFAH